MPIPRKLKQNYVETLVDDEVLIVDLSGGDLFSMSGSARAVWEAIDGGRDILAIIALLGAAHHGERDEIADDSSSLIAELVDAGLVALRA